MSVDLPAALQPTKPTTGTSKASGRSSAATKRSMPASRLPSLRTRATEKPLASGGAYAAARLMRSATAASSSLPRPSRRARSAAADAVTRTTTASAFDAYVSRAAANADRETFKTTELPRSSAASTAAPGTP